MEDDFDELSEHKYAAVAPSASPGPTTREQNFLKEFIITFETLPNLWDKSSVHYKNNLKRIEALKTLLPIYSQIKEDATIDDVRKKINSLKSNYRKELKKISDSTRNGAGDNQVYKPKSWVFHLLNFLQKNEEPLYQYDLKDEIIEVTEQTEQETFSSIRSSQPPKKKRRTLAVQNIVMSKPCSLLSQRTNYQPQSIDNNHVNPTAVYWSQKLNQLDEDQRLLAEKFINDILFEAALGNLKRDSRID